jgi:hypothetical protein
MNMGSGYAGQTAPAAKVEREATLNERLNRIAEALTYQCERLESVLSRVNGTPQAPSSSKGDVAQIRPTHPLAEVVQMLEATQERISSLTNGVERIA